MAIRRRTRWADDRGAAAVEFALVLIPLSLIIFGIIDFGRAYNAQETLTQSARVGARLASVGGTTTAVKNAVVDAAKPAVSVSATDVSVLGSCDTDTSVEVTVDYGFKYLALPFGNITISGKATAPC